MKAEWTIANHPEISGLEACAAKALETLRLGIASTVLVKVGEWMADVNIEEHGTGCRVTVTGDMRSWWCDVTTPTTAEEMARALLLVVRRGVDLRRDLYVAASEALATEMPGQDGAA